MAKNTPEYWINEPVQKSSLYEECLLEWHEKFNIPMRAVPSFPNPQRIKLRLSLLEEEVNELIAAIEERDIIKVADALGDILYIVHGTSKEFGIPIDPVFLEIHRSNMTKIWPDGTIHMREDGKILKPDTYEEPNLGKVLFEHIVKMLSNKFTMPNATADYEDFVRLFDGSLLPTKSNGDK